MNTSDKRAELVRTIFDSMDVDAIYDIALEHLEEYAKNLSDSELAEEMQNYGLTETL